MKPPPIASSKIRSPRLIRRSATASASEWLKLERDEGHAEQFEAVDVVLAGLAYYFLKLRH